jgi:uncharacterized RDD family membrane protein YckC
MSDLGMLSIGLTPAERAHRTLELLARTGALNLAWVALELVVETSLGASIGMLMMGLRIGTEDGHFATLRSRVVKTLLVHIPTFLAIPTTLSVVLGSGSAEEQLRAANDRGLSSYIGFAWVIAFLFAFGNRKQTLFDRVLGLATYRKAEMR